MTTPKSTPERDPIFALIDEHRAAYVERESFLSKHPDHRDEDFDPIYERELDLQRRLFAARAHTVAGAATYARYIVDYIREYPEQQARI